MGVCGGGIRRTPYAVDCGSLLPLSVRQPAVHGGGHGGIRRLSHTDTAGLAAGLHGGKRQQAAAVHSFHRLRTLTHPQNRHHNSPNLSRSLPRHEFHKTSCAAVYPRKKGGSFETSRVPSHVIELPSWIDELGLLPSDAKKTEITEPSKTHPEKHKELL